MKRISLSLITLFLCAFVVAAQKVPVQEVVLDNGMRLLLVSRKGDPNVSAGWVARVGSVNERPGITGLSHLFEHMMFKGTHVIGTKNIEENLRLIKEMDQVRAELRQEQEGLIKKARLGEINDPKDPKFRSERHKQLLVKFDELAKREKDIMVKDEFDRIYTTAGGSGMNASTSNDWTIYFINVPANKLELWFWMESDRLRSPVFREFYSERDVVHEERRLRTDSTPTGKFNELYDSMFWQSSPYGWPVVGWPSDLEGITREEALDYFAVNYAPNNLTAALVGDIDPAKAVALAKKYFGSLPRGPRAPEPVRTSEMPQLAEKRMVAYAETVPQVRVRYHTVAEGHPDSFVLDILGSVLSGRTGRLYKSLVTQQQVANSVFAFSNGRKYEGLFEMSGVAKPGKTPEEVEQALYKELDRLKTELVDANELQKVKNQYAAGVFRGIQPNFGLMAQLLLRDNTRGWETINSDPLRHQAVMPEDIRRVVNAYFKPENRTIAIYYTKKAAAGAAAGAKEDPALAGLTDQEKTQVNGMKAMLAQAKPEQIRAFLSRLEQQATSAPAERQNFIKVVRKMLEDRLKELEGGKQ